MSYLKTFIERHPNLTQAIKNGVLDDVKALISSMNENKNENILLTCIYFKQIGIIRYFVENYRCNNYFIIDAIRFGNIEILKYFIEERNYKPHRCVLAALHEDIIYNEKIDMFFYIIKKYPKLMYEKLGMVAFRSAFEIIFESYLQSFWGFLLNNFIQTHVEKQQIRIIFHYVFPEEVISYLCDFV